MTIHYRPKAHTETKKEEEEGILYNLKYIKYKKKIYIYIFKRYFKKYIFFQSQKRKKKKRLEVLHLKKNLVTVNLGEMIKKNSKILLW